MPWSGLVCFQRTVIFIAQGPLLILFPEYCSVCQGQGARRILSNLWDVHVNSILWGRSCTTGLSGKAGALVPGSAYRSCPAARQNVNPYRAIEGVMVQEQIDEPMGCQ